MTPFEYVPAQPARLRLPDREVVIDDWPLSHSPDERRLVDVTRETPDVLEIGPVPGAARKLVAGFLAPAALGVIPAAVALVLTMPWWLSVPFLAGAAWFLHIGVRGALRQLTWVRFDRSAGEVVFERRAGVRDRREATGRIPLASVLAVQQLYSGAHSHTSTGGDAERPTVEHREYRGYELNLILDDPKQPRRLLFALTDWQWLRPTGERIGAFLGVPVIDRLHHG